MKRQHFEDFEKNAFSNFEEIEKNHIKDFEEAGIGAFAYQTKLETLVLQDTRIIGCILQEVLFSHH